MAKISSLTDNTNDIIYPQTKANAVIMEDSSTVENAVNQRPKLILSASEPTGVVPENTLYGVFGDVGQITTGEIADSAVTTAKIASSAVTEAKLGTGAVTADKLGSSAVTTAKIANGAVTGVTNSATSIGSAKLALNTVGTPNLRDGAVTSDKIDWTTFKRWVPDYSNSVNLSLNSSGGVTLTENGWVTYYYYGYAVGSNHEVRIRVNNKTVFYQVQEAPAPNSARAIQGNITFPVSVGDVITQSGATAGRSATLFRGKWV